MPDSFNICNDVKQGGFLSLKLFPVYVGELSDNLINIRWVVILMIIVLIMRCMLTISALWPQVQEHSITNV